MINDLNQLSSHDLLEMYARLGTFDKCANAIGVNRKTWAKYWYENALPTPTCINKTDYEPNKYRVAVCGDLHFGSKQAQPTLFLEFVDKMFNEEIKTLIILGDIVEGLSKRDGSVHHRFLHSIDNIYDYTAEKFDQFADNFEKIHIIEGNHDATLNKRDDGFDLCRHLSDDFRTIHYHPTPISSINPVTIDGGVHAIMYHGSGNCTKNLTQRTRTKTIDFLNMGREFSCLLAAHCHRSSFDKWLNVYGISVGCFQTITDYLATKGMVPEIGGTVLEYNINRKGKICNLIPIQYNYDDKIIEHDY